MREIAWLVSALVVAAGVIAGGCGRGVVAMTRGMVENNPEKFARGYGRVRLCGWWLPGVRELPEWLDGKSYILLLQNNMELRPTGGFMGSYAKLKFERGGLADFYIQDIYVPDGKLTGYVKPPIQIQEAFKQGGWKLRDANWDVDFEKAGPEVAWFFEQGGETADGIMAVNLGIVEKVLGVLGGVELLDYPEKVTGENFYFLAQRYAQEGFFPGSTQKKDFLSAVGGGLWRRIQKADAVEMVELARAIYSEMVRGQTWVWMRNKNAEAKIVEMGLGGGLMPGKDFDDYLYIAEANLGANKANCCVKREVVQEIKRGSGENVDERLTVVWVNDQERGEKFGKWWGNYLGYIRVVVPAEARVKGVVAGGEVLDRGGYSVEERGEFKIVGFWVNVPKGGANKAEIYYERPRVGMKEVVWVRRQPGLKDFSYRLVVEGRDVADKKIDRDQGFTVRW